MASEAAAGDVDLDRPGPIVTFGWPFDDVRWRGDGPLAFDPNGPGLAFVAVPNPFAPEIARFTDPERLDSLATIDLPSRDIDREDHYHLRLAFYSAEPGPGLVTVTGSGTIPAVEFSQFILELVERALVNDRFLNAGRQAQWIPRRWLQARIRQIEETVRDGVADEDVTALDYRALRDYPERLAKVERLAQTIEEPIWGPRPGVCHIVNLDAPSVRKVAEEARTAAGSLSGLLASQQVLLAQRQANETERFQRTVTVVGATVLVPGLVAAVFGANVKFHGHDTAAGFWAMLLFMLAGVAASYALLRSVELRLWARLRRHRPLRWIADLSDLRRLALLAGGAVAASVAGLIVLLGS